MNTRTYDDEGAGAFHHGDYDGDDDHDDVDSDGDISSAAHIGMVASADCQLMT